MLDCFHVRMCKQVAQVITREAPRREETDDGLLAGGRVGLE
jgi:hypothetical protein